MFEGESDAEPDPDLATPRGSERDKNSHIRRLCDDRNGVSAGSGVTGSARRVFHRVQEVERGD